MLLPELILDIGTNYYEVAEWMEITPIEAAKYMIDQVADVGANAVKFQYYKADKFVRKDAEAFWRKDKTQYEVFKKQDLFGFDEYAELQEYCISKDIEFLCTAFDFESLEQINRLVKRHKIASGDITFAPLLKQVASYEKPVILSTGASDYTEIIKAIELLVPNEITLLHCVLKYPNIKLHANLDRIYELKKRFYCNAFRNGRRYCIIGYSDHCKFNINLLCAAWLLGAEVIEKHFTLSHLLKENDHEHSCNSIELRYLLAEMKSLQSMINNSVIQEDVKKLARRGVYAARNIKEGENIGIDDVEFLRPQGEGMTPQDFAIWADGIEFKAQKNYKKGEQLYGPRADDKISY